MDQSEGNGKAKKNILKLISCQNENPITYISKSPLMATLLSFKELNSTVNTTTSFRKEHQNHVFQIKLAKMTMHI